LRRPAATLRKVKNGLRVGKYDRTLDAERRAINGTLRAIKTELESFQKALVKGTNEILKKWEEQYKKQVPLNLLSITQNYFVVFDCSAATLGRIENDDLREKILGAFSGQVEPVEVLMKLIFHPLDTLELNLSLQNAQLLRVKPRSC